MWGKRAQTKWEFWHSEKNLTFLGTENAVWGLLFIGRTKATEAVPPSLLIQAYKREKGKKKNLHKSLLFRKVCVLVHFLSTRKPKINRFLGLIAVGYLNSLPVSIFTMMSWEPLIKHYRKNIYLITCIALHICYMDFSSIFKDNLLYVIIYFLLVLFWLFELEESSMSL